MFLLCGMLVSMLWLLGMNIVIYGELVLECWLSMLDSLSGVFSFGRYFW